MENDYWIEIKRKDFLDALKEIKPALRVRGAPERELQIGLVNSQLIFSVEGAFASRPAKGNWPGIASTRLAYFLTFLAANPAEASIRISYQDQKIRASTAVFTSKWRHSNDLYTGDLLHTHSTSQAAEKAPKFICPVCHKKQGVPIDSLPRGVFTDYKSRRLEKTADSLGHGFGCKACGHTWEEQVL